MTFVLLAVLLAHGNVLAGLYNPVEPAEHLFAPLPGNETRPRPIDFPSFLTNLFYLRSIGMDQVTTDNPMRMRYVLVADSAPRNVPAEWPVSRKLSLSAYLIRRGKRAEAIELLRPLSIRERGNFLVLANLATAYQLQGQEPATAGEYLDQALAAWPRTWETLDRNMKDFLDSIFWTRESFLWYREAEGYHRKLVKLRAGEARGRRRSASLPSETDDLFGVRFIGDSGQFEPGKLAAKEKARLPANALAVVQQLLVWLPDDGRLYWLLGEIYNARGDTAAARQIFTDLAGFNGSYPAQAIKDHRRALDAAPPTPVPEQTSEPVASPPATNDGFVLDMRNLLVGFGAGTIVAFLAAWQFRVFRRRPAPKHSAG